MKNKVYPIITKNHSKNIWRKYIKCIEEYKLLENGDVIFVPIKIYEKANEHLCKLLLTMSSEFKMYDIKVIVGEDFSMMEKYNCNKVVAAEAFENIADNTLWEMLYNGRISSYLPKETIKHYTLIRPLYLIHHEDILACYKDILDTTNEIYDEDSVSMSPKCLQEESQATISEMQSDIFGELTTNIQKRKELAYLRSIIDRLATNNEAVSNNVFGSTVNVDADMLPAYWSEGEKHVFLDEYDCKNRSCK